MPIGPILQVSASDLGGGAERVAFDLHKAFRSRDLDARLAVGRRFTQSEEVFLVPNDDSRSLWARTVLSVLPQLPGPHTAASPAVRTTRRILKSVAEPYRALLKARGFEDFEYPGTRTLPETSGSSARILHLHNLHGGYFDLRQLPRLSAALPTVLTPHDTWLASGHCAYSLDCPLWITGCGPCPRLDVIVSVPRDNTRRNWQRKREIYRQSKVHIAAPSEWVLAQLERSIFADAISTARVIPNGVDTRVFHPGDRNSAREHLGLPHDAPILVFNSASETNPYKDFGTLLSAVDTLARTRGNRSIMLVAIGAQSLDIGSSGALVRTVPYLEEPSEVAAYLQAADICIHAAHAENHPLAVIEAQACGLPVVASNVGGIPEIVTEGKTGHLVSPGNALELSNAVVHLIDDGATRHAMGESAAARARARFSLERMADDYLSLYAAIEPNCEMDE